MSEEKKELFVMVPLHIVQKEARRSRTMKLILNKFLAENKLPGSQRTFEVSFDHNKAYELEEKKKVADKLKAEIKESETKSVPELLQDVKKANNAADNKKRN